MVTASAGRPIKNNCLLTLLV